MRPSFASSIAAVVALIPTQIAMAQPTAKPDAATTPNSQTTAVDNTAPPAPPASPEKGSPEKGKPSPSSAVTLDKAPSERVGDRPASDGFLERYVLESGRIQPVVPDPDFLLFSLHGEYELRFRAQSDLRLEPPIADQSAAARELGLNKYLYHWLRLNPRLDVGDVVSVVGQIDLPRGVFIGDSGLYVDAAKDTYSKSNWYNVYPRELYVEWRSPMGLFRLGQQKNHWGEGLVANDGDHPQMFGDTNRGDIVERLLFATTPLGKGTPFLLAAAGDLVFQDKNADLTNGDYAMQGVLAALYRVDVGNIGLYGVVRHQWHHAQAIDMYTPFSEYLTVGVVDLAGKLRGKIPGANGYAYIAGEAATIFGSTSFIRSNYGNALDPTAARDKEKILSYGGSLTAGFVHLRKGEKEEWGDAVAELEFGYASGDADPFDGTEKRFTFEQSHNVGLVLFNDVLRWKTARSATIAADPRLVNRPNPGLQFLPSEGGVFGATYLNPRFVVRPKRWADVKLGFVLAQATADFVDPYQVGAKGNYANYDGGDPTRRDLGFEIDSGFDFRIPIGNDLTRLELGAEGGVLFPGRAFDDALGNGLGKQYVGNVKVGMQF